MARHPREQTYGEWLDDALDRADMSVAGLAEKTGLSLPGIYNIINGVTQNPQKATRDKIEKALQDKPEKDIVETMNEETNVIGLGHLQEFFPHDPAEAPAVKGVYVFYDTFDRPVYVGKAVKQDIKKRIDQHREKFWFRDPIVSKARYIEVSNPQLCSQIEMLLIRFLGSHNVLNKRGAEAYKPSDVNEDT